MDPGPPPGSWLSSLEGPALGLGQATVQSLLAPVAAAGTAREHTASRLVTPLGPAGLPSGHPAPRWALHVWP